jgi:hypothetical protein
LSDIRIGRGMDSLCVLGMGVVESAEFVLRNIACYLQLEKDFGGEIKAVVEGLTIRIVGTWNQRQYFGRTVVSLFAATTLQVTSSRS